VGPALAAPLYALGGGGTSGFYAIFYFGAALSACSLIALVLLIREPEDVKEQRAKRRQETRAGGRRRRATRPPYRLIFTAPIIAFVVIAFTSHFAMGAWDVVWSLYLSGLGASKTFISMTWVAFSVPMLLSFRGGMLADRWSRFWLFAIGYALSGCAWIFYGISTNLTALIIVNVLEGIAIAFSYPAKQAFLIQVSPKRWLGTVTGVEATSMQLAGLLGSLLAPLMFAHISGHVLTVAGIVSLCGLAGAAPILHKEWKRIKASGGALPQAELERLADETPAIYAGEPRSGPE
jgi:MFS family permease